MPMAIARIQASASRADATGIPMYKPINATHAERKLAKATFLTGQPDASNAAMSPVKYNGVLS